jgi:hypothetical protein
MKRDRSIFEGIGQTNVVIGGYTCTLPLFYTGGTATIGMFPARLSKLRAKAPDPRLEPAAVFPGIGIVSIVAFEFQTTIGPVNELCIAVPLRNGPLPFGLSLLKGLLRGYMPVWVWHLPVSTEIANVFGREVWGFPKIHADIPITQDPDGSRHCLLSERGRPILALHGKALSGSFPLRITLKNHLWQDGCIQTADHVFHLRETGISLSPGRTKLELLSDHPIARDLEDVLLTRNSIGSAFAPSLQALLHEPDRMPLSLTMRLLDAARTDEEAVQDEPDENESKYSRRKRS